MSTYKGAGHVRGLLVAALFAVTLLPLAAAARGGDREITVMTRNLYLGFDLPAALNDLLLQACRNESSAP